MGVPQKIFWVFTLLSVLGASGLAAGPASPPACGGVILGFDAHRQPILPTGEFYRSRVVVPPGKITGYSFTIDSTTVDMAYAAYLLDLLNLVSGQIQHYSGPPPNPNLAITVKYDSDPAHQGWFFYDASTNSILITSYPAGPYHHDDDGDNRVDEDLLDGADNDGDGRTDEDLANDPVYDGVMLHELTHSYHDDFGLFASWAEEGMNECAAELVAEHLYRNKIRDVRGRTPQVNLQYFDTWNTMGPDVMGGTTYSFYKSLPDLIYRGAPALFFTLAATQSPTYAGYPAGYTYLAALNAALRLRQVGGTVSESAFYEAVDAAVAQPQPVDGILPVSRWVRSRAVANTVSRPGAFLGIYTAFGLTGAGTYFTIVNPSFFNVFAFRRVVNEFEPWNTRESILTGATPVYVSIYNTNGNLVWTAASGGNPYVTLIKSNGYNWFQIGHTENWPAGWYRIEARCQWPGLGYLTAENYFLVLGPEYNAGRPLDDAAEGLGLIALGAGQTYPSRTIGAGPATVLPWLSGWACLARPQDLQAFPGRVQMDLEGESREVTVPLPYTRVLPLRDRAVYLPDVRGSDADYSGISVVDGGVTPAACRLDWRDGAGVPVGDPNPLNPLNLALSPGQLAINMAGGATGFFGVTSPSPGWVRLGSDAPVQAFSLNGDFAGQYLDGTPALADLSTRWLAPAVVTDWGAQNRLVVINPMAAPASFLLELHHYNTSGVPAATSLGWYLPARGQLEVDLAEAFSTQYVADTDYVLLRASAPVAAASQMASGDFLAVLALQPQRDVLQAAADQPVPTPAPVDLFAPQFAVGGGWWTRLALLNADPAAAADVVLTAFYTVGGAPLSTEVTLRLNPGEKRAADVQQLFGLAPGGGILGGWIRVRCSRSLVQGAVLYGNDSGAYLSAQPLERTALKRMLFGHVASGPAGGIDYFTGLALLNPADAQASVWVTVHDPSGAVLRTTAAPILLAPGQRLSQMITDYFPDLGPTLGGWIEVQADQGLLGYVLFGDTGLQFLSAVPPMAVE
jgi:hypothetical protein